jgi:hypothetical protein
MHGKRSGDGTAEPAVSGSQPTAHYEPRTIQSADIPTTADVLGVDSDGRIHFATSTVGDVTVYSMAAIEW